MKFKELDPVKALVQKDFTPKGSIGAIVCAFTHHNKAYMVEFFNKYGETLDTPIYLPEELSFDGQRMKANSSLGRSAKKIAPKL
ncbi:MAG: DUF4926 domain-containing protein [Deltaproteobacteria bacterium]|jgi:hypothetical protein|nr:DUF4926 domain-containing protein [Deltaproteobacteria bacterium]